MRYNQAFGVIMGEQEVIKRLADLQRLLKSYVHKDLRCCHEKASSGAGFVIKIDGVRNNKDVDEDCLRLIRPTVEQVFGANNIKSVNAMVGGTHMIFTHSLL